MIGEGESGEGRRTWIVSFADLLSLMLTFMVMLFATADLDAEAWPATADMLAETLDWSGRELPSDAARYSAEGVRQAAALDLDYLALVLQTSLAEDSLFATLGIHRRRDRLIVAMPDALLFAAGEAQLSAQARRALAGLAATLGSIGNRLGVEGHTDPRPIPPGGMFASNWELSLARALAVAEALTQSGMDRPVACYGLADTRYDELGDTAEDDRRTAARRVDLVLFANAGDEK